MDTNKENLSENPTPRRMTRSMMVKNMPESAKKSVDVETQTSSKKAAAKTPSKTPGKTLTKTPSKALTKTPKKTVTPRKTPGKKASGVENRKTPGKVQSAKKIKPETPRSLRATRSRSVVLEFPEKASILNASSTRKNLFPENCDDPKIENVHPAEVNFRKSQEVIIAETEAEKDDISEEEKHIDEAMDTDYVSSPPSPIKDDLVDENSVKSSKIEEFCTPAPLVTPEKPEAVEEPKDEVEISVESESVILAGLQETQTINEGSIITINDSPTIVIPDTPFEKEINRTLNETFSPEPKDIVFKEHPIHVQDEEIAGKSAGMEDVPQRTFKGTPYIRNVISSTKKITFAPAIASSALKSSILLENKFISPLKSIRKRSFSTTDADCSRKINRVKFHSPANMEITIDEIDDSMRPHIDGIRQERDAHVAKEKAKVKEMKKTKGRKRSMSNIETEPAKKRALHNISSAGQKTPTKEHHAVGKVPNFGAIHAASFSRMENLLDYKIRKEERAKNLLNISGKCIPSSSSKNVQEADNVIPVDEVAPLVEKAINSVPPEAPQTQQSSSNAEEVDGGNETANVGILSRPPVTTGMVTMRKVEERQQKWRTMHKSAGRHDNEKSGASNTATTTTTKARAAVLKGVRTNRRFDLMMKFREKEN
ncbi:hypothetical protein DMENIID0001_120770 [Sergentomyia squamirostris]